jgi:hypothetical protein
MPSFLIPETTNTPALLTEKIFGACARLRQDVAAFAILAMLLQHLCLGSIGSSAFCRMWNL